MCVPSSCVVVSKEVSVLLFFYTRINLQNSGIRTTLITAAKKTQQKKKMRARPGVPVHVKTSLIICMNMAVFLQCNLDSKSLRDT